jgi:alpha-galactosidase
MIKVLGSAFLLSTNNTSYAMRVLPTGQLEHLYYGQRIEADKEEDLLVLSEKHAFPLGNQIAYDEESSYSLENMRLEYSGYGKGDFREPLVELVFPDHTSTTDFLFDYATYNKEKKPLHTLPSSHGECDHLYIRLKERNHDVDLILDYYIYEEDVITRTTKIINHMKEDLIVERAMSLCLDFEDDQFEFITFNGGWADEMHKHIHNLSSAKIVNASCMGTSSSRAQNFVMLSRFAKEDEGEVYGFNLIYSGNHKEVVEVSSTHKTRIVTGINNEQFSYCLKSEEVFEAPEAIMGYSYAGFNGLSNIFHRFVNEHIIKKEWAYKERPILINSWEAMYFNVNEKRILSLAKEASEMGIELFVLDDGWFKGRADDTRGLGDWEVDRKKLPKGLDHLSRKIHKMGMKFGIWVEPEMTNENSDYYREHPDWVIKIDGQMQSLGRHQYVIDLSKDEVVDDMISRMTALFSSCQIDYVKWDMNRVMSDVFSTCRKGEVFHRYICGLYRMMDTLTSRFPHILFEGCASGGNRFDLGILSYFPQIWASDNTDSWCRFDIQNSYSYGYPQSTFTNHVSGVPNHQTLRVTPLALRFHVAAFGLLGYEVNLLDLSKKEKEDIKQQIIIYKKQRALFQFGNMYRIDMGWMAVDEKRSHAVGMLFKPINELSKKTVVFKCKGLDPLKRYHFYNQKMTFDIKEMGSLINTASPIHIKQGSLSHRVISKFVHLQGEEENHYASGSLLMNAGVFLKQGFSATGFNEDIRFDPDFFSRLYFIEESAL